MVNGSKYLPGRYLGGEKVPSQKVFVSIRVILGKSCCNVCLHIYIYTHSMSSIFDMIYNIYIYIHMYIYIYICHHVSLPFHHFIRFSACFGIAPGVSLAYSNKPSDMRSKLLPMVRPLEMFPE